MDKDELYWTGELLKTKGYIRSKIELPVLKQMEIKMPEVTSICSKLLDDSRSYHTYIIDEFDWYEHLCVYETFKKNIKNVLKKCKILDGGDDAIKIDASTMLYEIYHYLDTYIWLIYNLKTRRDVITALPEHLPHHKRVWGKSPIEKEKLK